MEEYTTKEVQQSQAFFMLAGSAKPEIPIGDN